VQEKKKKKDLHTAREDRGGGRHTKGLCSSWKTSFSSAEGQLSFQHASLISEEIICKGKYAERAWLRVYTSQP